MKWNIIAAILAVGLMTAACSDEKDDATTKVLYYPDEYWSEVGTSSYYIDGEEMNFVAQCSEFYDSDDCVERWKASALLIGKRMTIHDVPRSGSLTGAVGKQVYEIHLASPRERSELPLFVRFGSRPKEGGFARKPIYEPPTILMLSAFEDQCDAWYIRSSLAKSEFIDVAGNDDVIEVIDWGYIGSGDLIAFHLGDEHFLTSLEWNYRSPQIIAEKLSSHYDSFNDQGFDVEGFFFQALKPHTRAFSITDIDTKNSLRNSPACVEAIRLSRNRMLETKSAKDAWYQDKVKMDRRNGYYR